MSDYGEPDPPHDTMDGTVSDVERIPIEVPFRDIPGRNMRRELPHWKYFEIVRVELVSGHRGFGETMTYYTWERTGASDVERILGEDARKHMWDDSLGAGLQMALFDAVARQLDVPLHALLGKKIRDEASLAWWCIDMPADDLLAECERALDAGYRDVKFKGRPWFDIRRQLRVLDDALPDRFNLDIDFNDTLLDADRAIPLLRELERHPQVHHFESPIPQEDVDGNRRIKDTVETDVALHYGSPPAIDALREDICDGFVLMGGANQLRNEAAVAAMADKPFWLQLVGTEITAAFSLHLAAVLGKACWPAITCHQLYAESPVAGEIVVSDGKASIPDGPGLGFELDEATLDRLRCDEFENERTVPQSLDDSDHSMFYARMQTSTRPSPRRLIRTVWPDGLQIFFSGENDQLLRFAQEGGMPYFCEDVETEFVPDDNSSRWDQLRESAAETPVVRGGE